MTESRGAYLVCRDYSLSSNRSMGYLNTLIYNNEASGVFCSLHLQVVVS